MTLDIIHGDSRFALQMLPSNSIDSIVTDPPYALVSIGKRFGAPDAAPAKGGVYNRSARGFMGQKWDTGDTAFDPAFWFEALRVVKPGAHVLAFGGTRTYHRLACAIEDAGFEIRDQIGWLYGSLMLCRGCNEEKPLEEFPSRNDRSGRKRPYCHSCSNSISRARYQKYKNSNPFKWKCVKIKGRAKSLKIPFDLTPEYLEKIWTGYCPITKEEIIWDADKSNPNAAELDRILPEKGYVKGNVVFMSRRMNKIKADVTYGEIIRLGEWLGNYTH